MDSIAQRRALFFRELGRLEREGGDGSFGREGYLYRAEVVEGTEGLFVVAGSFLSACCEEGFKGYERWH